MVKALLHYNCTTLTKMPLKKGSYKFKIFTKHCINYSIITVFHVNSHFKTTWSRNNNTEGNKSSLPNVIYSSGYSQKRER